MSRGRRETDHRRATQVLLLKDGHEVARFAMPWTDPRFVGPDKILESALEIVRTRPSRRADDFDLLVEWDMLRFHWGWNVYACDPEGNRIWNAG